MAEADDILKGYLGGGDVPPPKDDNTVKAKTADDYINSYLNKPDDVIQSDPKQEFWQGLSTDPSWSGLAKKIGVGVLRGGKDVIDTGAHGLQNATVAVADKVLPEAASSKIKSAVDASQSEDKAGRDAYDKEYGDSLASGVGRIGGQIIATAPLMPAKAFQAIDAAAGALPVLTNGVKVAAPVVNRLVGAAGKGALGGAEFGAGTASTNDKSLPENVGEGAISGAIGGPVIAGAGAIGKGLSNAVSSGISPTRAALADRAAQLGIDLKASQVSNSPTFKKYDQMSGMLPLSGAQAEKDKQVSQFTKAISNTFGKDTDEITPAVVKDARKIQGKRIEAVGANSTITADPQLSQDLHSIINDAKGTLTKQEMSPVFQNIKNIIEKINPNGQIDGEAYTALTAYKGVLSKAQKSSNPNIRNAANDIRNALDDALTRSVSPQQKAELLDARKKYKAVMTIKDLVEGDPEGHVSPLKLMQKVMKAPGGKSGAGDLGDLADIGRAFFPTPSDSGTPLGTKLLDMAAPFTRSPVGAALATAGALKSGIGLVDMGLSAATLPVNRLIRKAANSASMREDIINAAKGQTYGKTDRLGDKLIPYSSLPVDKSKRPRVYITKDD